MKIFIGADHRGFVIKQKLIKILAARGHHVVDVGSFQEGVACDYPGISLALGTKVTATPGSRGILVCLTGIGHSIAANKIPGVYAALCYSVAAAKLSRQHNNANVLVLGAGFVPANQINTIIFEWLKAEFEGGRHLRRVKQIKAIEKRFLKST